MTAILDAPIEVVPEAKPPKVDPRQTAIVVALSRNHVRLPHDTVKSLCADIIAELDRVAPLEDGQAAAAYRRGPEPTTATCSCGGKDERKDWEPQRKNNRVVRAKNPRPGIRVCSMCQQEKSTRKKSTGMPGGEFVLHREKDGDKLSSRCRDCLKAAARNRYLSTKRLAAMNMVRLAFVADQEVAGLRCLDCSQEFVIGDEVVACSGLRHDFCDGDARW